jgi:hypothetical protein
MAHHIGHPLVDLTDENEGRPGAAEAQHGRRTDYTGRDTSSYVSSPSNPAKRSRLDTNNLNPIALLNPKAFGTASNGASQPRSTSAVQDGWSDSFNQRIESLHGVKDRKIAKPSSSNEIKRDNTQSTDNSRTSLLSKNVLPHTPPTTVIDLTGSIPFVCANSR